MSLVSPIGAKGSEMEKVVGSNNTYYIGTNTFDKFVTLKEKISN